MREQELRTHLFCNGCARKIGQVSPLFWTVTAQRYGLEAHAIARQHALAVMLRSAPLAEVMGPDEELANPIGEASNLTLCDECATLTGMPIGAIALTVAAERAEKPA